MFFIEITIFGIYLILQNLRFTPVFVYVHSCRTHYPPILVSDIRCPRRLHHPRLRLDSAPRPLTVMSTLPRPHIVDTHSVYLHPAAKLSGYTIPRVPSPVFQPSSFPDTHLPSLPQSSSCPAYHAPVPSLASFLLSGHHRQESFPRRQDTGQALTGHPE